MHVGLNLIFLVPGETGGMEIYARQLVAALARADPDLQLTAFVNRETAGEASDLWGEAIPAVTIPVRARRRSDWVRGEQRFLPVLARRAGIDLLHSLGSTAPAWGGFRRVVTIHDVTYRVHPEAHVGLRSLGMRVLVPLAARRSDHIIVPSARTRDDLVSLLRVDERRVTVIASGYGRPPVADPTEAAVLRDRFGLGEREVVLTPAAAQRHKNVGRLLDALALIPTSRRPLLVVTGYQTRYERDLRERSSRLALDGDVVFTGWLPDADLDGLFGLARCLMFPSLYEGFGFPVSEAMARGLPVACSDRGALPEVAGDAALLFDPEDPRAIADAIERILGDPGLAGDLRTRGLLRATRLSWERCARETLAVYTREFARPGAE